MRETKRDFDMSKPVGTKQTTLRDLIDPVTIFELTSKGVMKTELPKHLGVSKDTLRRALDERQELREALEDGVRVSLDAMQSYLFQMFFEPGLSIKDKLAIHNALVRYKPEYRKILEAARPKAIEINFDQLTDDQLDQVLENPDALQNRLNGI